MEALLTIVVIVGLVLVLGLASSVRIVRQYERGLVFRFGRVHRLPREPGLQLIVPGVDHMHKVNLQIVTLPVPGQDGITRDNVTVRVDAVVYFKVIDPVQAIVGVENYRFAMLQVAQASLRRTIGESSLDDLLSRREYLNQGLELMIDSPAASWGIHIDRVEIKDVALPETMKRAMSRQAEAERERRGRVISAEGELQASEKLSQAAARMADTPAALQLRLLETVVEVAAEKNSTLVLPFPVEMLRFLDEASKRDARRNEDQPSEGRQRADRPSEARGVEHEPEPASDREALGTGLTSRGVPAPSEPADAAEQIRDVAAVPTAQADGEFDDPVRG
ncbi:slipin family protein [Saccharomonospora saliphila]|uniref:slipin family protein n=1 Tax=Saccharomonospora saliphila TaxID=369829 RepID=UPI000361B97A|nr:slipin family protein [Saccharomonospora saliphila]